MVSSSVMILVTLAGSSCSCSFRAYSTCPVVFSISSAARLWIGSSAACACTGHRVSRHISAVTPAASPVICRLHLRSAACRFFCLSSILHLSEREHARPCPVRCRAPPGTTGITRFSASTISCFFIMQFLPRVFSISMPLREKSCSRQNFRLQNPRRPAIIAPFAGLVYRYYSGFPSR